MNDLRRLSKLVYGMTHREVWLGGKVSVPGDKMEGPWPDGVKLPYIPVVYWAERIGESLGRSTEYVYRSKLAEAWYWTLSPEVALLGFRLRVCVTSGYAGGHEVTVFVDGERKHPGGHYRCDDWWWHRWPWPRWSTRIADLERTDGGRSGPVDQRDRLIAAAEAKLSEEWVRD